MSFERNACPKRGERKARWMIERLAKAGVPVEPTKCSDGKWGLRFPEREAHTQEQKAVVVDAMLFGVGFPRCFGTMIRLLLAREAGE